ncbi:unnamed protein product [Onchocerca flexuosa]|nr:unnamed protein product [Onchocerca flexuosa]
MLKRIPASTLDKYYPRGGGVKDIKEIKVKEENKGAPPVKF